MIVLGMEGSANKLGIGILRNDEILVNLRETFIPEIGQGLIPKEVAEHHRKHINKLIHKAFKEANLQYSDIDCICYTKGPGMAMPLLVVLYVAKTLSILWNKPLIPVNHCVGHIEMGRLVTKSDDSVVLYVSGGNTQVITYLKDRYMIIGETMDIAVGNCFDKIARFLDLSNDPSPGYNLEVMAQKGVNYIFLPYSLKGMDVSFSGIYSSVKKIMAEEHPPSIEDICFSVQETVFAMLVEVTERAMAYANCNSVLIVGGVGCNVRLQEMMNGMVRERGGILHATDERYCVDNGAMIARAGMLAFRKGYNENAENHTVSQR